ncbi:cytosine deaminase [Friedmanniella luteola]|uniref:Cytosine deaminase n=1 Tax=Friedmanniella luteola TaxID=546871 RepID=A0A1H1ZJS2_9ACTN|nr:amidohydrolase family protein [Friedmanniella luteola]SDT33910.1 cytosine deaminase [Friedmanniella luteola]
MPGPAELSLLRNATLADGSRVDVEIAAGRVVAVLPAGQAEPTAAELDLDGHLLLPATADPHAHLDKARSWDAIRPPMGDLGSAIAAWRAHAATMTEDDVAARARAQALAMLAAGTTAIRSHVDIRTGDDPTLGTRALVRVREELAPLLDLELVALAGPETTDRAVEEALDLGVDLVGGACHLALDPHDDLARLLAIAERRGVGVDLHVDESLDGPVTLDAFARAVRGWTVNVSAGHCCRLGTLPGRERARVIAEVLASDVGVIANPITNLYLQGWQHPTSTPRGLTPARELLDAGVRFAAGADNVRDPFNPLGRGDALETAMLLVVAGHLTVTEAYAAVSSGAREVMRLPVAGPVVGAVADLLAVRGADLAAVVADAPADRVVVRGGRVVARTTTATEVALPWSAPLAPAPVSPEPVPPAITLEASR